MRYNKITSLFIPEYANAINVTSVIKSARKYLKKNVLDNNVPVDWCTVTLGPLTDP